MSRYLQVFFLYIEQMWSLINKATPIIIIIIHYSTCIDFEMSLQALGSRQVHYFGSGNFMFKKIDYGNKQILKKHFRSQ